MNILIIEDEEMAARRLAQLIKEVEPNAIVSGPIDSVKEAVKHLQEKVFYDLLMLDIQLADGKSFSIFEQINLKIPVIFTTAYDEYAIKAFEINSIDYLLKPINIEKLRSSLAKFNSIKTFYSSQQANSDLLEVLRSIRRQTNITYKTRFLVNRGDSLLPISTSEIVYFIAEDKAVCLVTNQNKKHLVNNSLDDLELKLDPKQFFRVNRQIIASIGSIAKIHNYFNYKLKLDIIPDPGTEIIVSKSRTSDFKSWMNGE